MDVYPIRQFERRARELLAELDAFAETAPDAEDLEELNAELEDALMLVSGIRQEDDGWREEFADALEELDALAGDYAALDGGGDLAALARRLESAVRMAADNLD